MAFQDTHCPCGGTKERETLICTDCCQHFTGTLELATYLETSWPRDSRRTAAIRLLSMARKRSRKLALIFHD